jgi:hypothetical protein
MRERIDYSPTRQVQPIGAKVPGAFQFGSAFAHSRARVHDASTP